jgi:ATP-dependent DNA helicase RecQ
MTSIAEIADPVLDLVERTWGFSSLRPLQRQAIDAVLAGRDSLLVVPTGAGKSLCFQAPALLLEGLTVVVSPLIALMKDQVDALVTSGVAAAALNSTTASDDQRTIERAAVDGSLRLLFVSPERLATASLRALLGRARVRAFAIDEAHCISHWGHDFRPEYRQLRELHDLFPAASVHAFTATATEQVRSDICHELRLREPLVLVGDLDRPNLRYRVVPRTDEVLQIEDVIRRHPREAGIVYCIRRKDVDFVAATLASRGHRVAGYHAGMGPEERREAQEAFASERVDIVVATVAFGMGIDRSNVRFVVHAGMPKSIEHYQQEAGRAGRDGLVSECVLLYTAGDAMTWTRILEQSISGEQLAVAVAHLEAMNRFCMSGICRHRALVEHFGGTWSVERCDACDLCLGELETVADSKTIAQKILSCVVRVRESFGAAHVAGVLRGERTARILDRQHDLLSTFGLLAEHDKDDVRGWIAQLVACGALMQEGHPRPFLRLGPGARPILRGEAGVRLVQTSNAAIGDGSEEWTGVDRELFEALRTWRREAAAARNVAPFVIFSDRTLREIAAVRPSSVDWLRSIVGIGEVRLREHGQELMQVIDTICAERELERDVNAPAMRAPRERTRTPRPTAAKAEAIRLFREGSTLEEVMERTGRARSTVIGDLCEIIENGSYQPSLRIWMTEETEQLIRNAAAEAGIDRLRPIKDLAGEAISYDDIHIVVATIRAAARN